MLRGVANATTKTSAGLVAAWSTGPETAIASMLRVDEKVAVSCATKRATLRETARTACMVRAAATPWIVMKEKNKDKAVEITVMTMTEVSMEI